MWECVVHGAVGFTRAVMVVQCDHGVVGACTVHRGCGGGTVTLTVGLE